MLIKKEGFLSGEAIGEKLGISRAAVAGAVKQLRGSGCDIESVTNRGYRLRTVPDLLNEGTMLARLDEARMERVVCLDTTDSTNRYMARLTLDGAPDGQVVIANAQTAGRGRLSRAFHSPGGMGVYFSYLMRPREVSASGKRQTGTTKREIPAEETEPATWTRVTSMTAVAVSNAIETVCGIRPSIKWVNDLYLKKASGGTKDAPFGAKICGILTQMDLEPDSGHVRSVIVGIGVNVAEKKTDFPKELRATAGSLYTETGKRVLRAELAAEMTLEMDRMRASLTDPDGEYLARYRAASMLPGMEVTVIAGDVQRPATALSVEEDFALRVRYDNGEEECLRGGEVSIRSRGRKKQ